MKWMLLFLFVLLAGSAYAEVATVGSGVFRGSMRHIVTISPEDVVTGVSAGDYLSFRFVDGSYLTQSDHEELDVYVRRYDLSGQMMVFDVDLTKFLEIEVGEEHVLDIDYDGVDDVVVLFESLDRKGTFVVRDVNAVPSDELPEGGFDEICTIACHVDADCIGECVLPGTCDAFCFESTQDLKVEDEVEEVIEEPVIEEEVVPEKGWFARFFEWLARLV